MEKKMFAWSRKALLALCALVVALCCAVLVGCGEDPDQAVRTKVSQEFDAVKNLDEETIEATAASVSAIEGLSVYGITATDAYKAIFKDFDYKIESVSVDGDKATVSVKFTTKDLAEFNTALTAAAEKADAEGLFKGLDEEQANAAVGKLVLETIESLPTTTTMPIEFTCVEKDGSWQLASGAGKILQEALFPTSVMNQ